MDALRGRLDRLDCALLEVSLRTRGLVYLATVLVMVATALPHVPRPVYDFAGVPGLGALQRHDTYGNDTIGDGYEARVVLNDWRDMYTKRRVEMTPLEAATWSKAASAPYPPAVLLAEASLYALGTRLGIGFYGAILTLALIFVTSSAVYFWRTRWYLFPALYLNFVYFSERFVHVQDCSYLVMLTVVMAALFMARRKRAASHALVALATAMKLSPLYYIVNLPRMRARDALLYVGILIVGLIAPYVVWENYLYIYRYGAELKGDWDNAAGALLVAIPFAIVVRYVETRLAFDWEDRLGWGLVPFALLLALKMNVARHLLIVLLVPDKRGVRNLAAAVGLAVPVLFGVPFNASLAFAALALAAGLALYLSRIGWNQVRRDLRAPGRTLAEMFLPPARVTSGAPAISASGRTSRS
jgi:hypothetical protein